MMAGRIGTVVALSLLLGASADGQIRRRVVPPPPTHRSVVTPPRRSPTPTTSPASVPAAQPAAAPPAAVEGGGAPADELSVTLVTFGPGDQVWERFGHNALWFHDERAGTDVAYNWGLFDFDQPDFVQRFLSGDTKYWMDGEDAIRMLAVYHDLGRTITLQRLNLTSAQAASLREYVQLNALDENKYYRYDYFRDNCSTRLRDAIDYALDGALRNATDTVTTHLSYRSESVRLTSGDIPIQAGIDVALGRPADAPLTKWESFFIPMRLRDAARNLSIETTDSQMIPLVTDQRTIAPTAGTQGVVVPAEAPDLTLRYLLLGVLVALLVVGLRILMVARRAAAWALTLFGIVWSLFCGVLGLLLLYVWFFTRHAFWAWNEHLLVLSPISLPLVILLPAALLRSRAVGRARMNGYVVAALGIVALALALIPGGQSSLPVVALFLPVHLALAWALSRPLPEPVYEEKTT